MLKYLIQLSLIIVPLSAKPAETFNKWIPKGWKTIMSASGDLNKDGLSDIVLVIEENNHRKLIKNDTLGPAILNTNLRRIMILLRNSSDYSLVLSNDSFIPSEHQEDVPCLLDPTEEGGIEINRGLLMVKFKYWLSCGSWSVENQIFTFRYEEKKFRLIGYDSSDNARNSGKQNEISINYLTRKKKITSNMNLFDASENKPQVVWINLKNHRDYYLNNIGYDCRKTTSASEWCRI